MMPSRARTQEIYPPCCRSLDICESPRGPTSCRSPRLVMEALDASSEAQTSASEDRGARGRRLLLLGDGRVLRVLNQLDGREAVLLVVVALAGVGDDAVVGREQTPAPLSACVLVNGVGHARRRRRRRSGRGGRSGRGRARGRRGGLGRRVRGGGGGVVGWRGGLRVACGAGRADRNEQKHREE